MNSTWLMPDQKQSTQPPASAGNNSPSNRTDVVVTSLGVSSGTYPAKCATRQSHGAVRKPPLGGLNFRRIGVCSAHTNQARALGGSEVWTLAGAYTMTGAALGAQASGLRTRGRGAAERALTALSSQTLEAGKIHPSAGTRRHTFPILGSSCSP